MENGKLAGGGSLLRLIGEITVLSSVFTFTLTGIILLTHSFNVKAGEKPEVEPRDTKNGFVGSWHMDYCTTPDSPVIFYKEGGYWCFYQREIWIGVWKIREEKGKRILRVDEWVKPDKEGELPTRSFWFEVELERGGMKGKVVRTASELGALGDWSLKK